MTWTNLDAEFALKSTVTASEMQSLGDNAEAIAVRNVSAPFVGNGWGRELLQSFDIDSLGAVEVLGLTSSFDSFEIYMCNMSVNSGDSSLPSLQVTADSGVSWSHFTWRYIFYGSSGGDFRLTSSLGTIGHHTTYPGSSVSDIIGASNHYLRLNNANAGNDKGKTVSGEYNTITGSGPIVYTGFFNNIIMVDSNIDGIRVFTNSGHYSHGNVRVYGISTNSF